MTAIKAGSVGRSMVLTVVCVVLSTVKYRINHQKSEKNEKQKYTIGVGTVPKKSRITGKIDTPNSYIQNIKHNYKSDIC